MRSKLGTKFLIGMIITGIIIRLCCLSLYGPEHGAVLQAAMAQSYLENGEFIMEFGPIFEPENLEPSLSRHFPPLYPLIIAMHAKTPDFDLGILKTLSFILSIITALLIYVLTQKHFDQFRAFIVTAIFALYGPAIDSASKCLAENIQLCLVMVFISLFIQSREKLWMLVPAGFALGVGYLSKSTIPFWWTVGAVVIGVILLGIKDRKSIPWAVGGFICFMFVALTWGLRNYEYFNTFETSNYISGAASVILDKPLEFIVTLARNGGVMFLALWIPVLIFWKQLKKINISDPVNFVLLFFSAGVFIITVIYAAVFNVAEGMFDKDNSCRYIIPATIPMMWLIFKHVDIEKDKVKQWFHILVILAFVFGLSVFLYSLYPDQRLINEADLRASREIPGLIGRIKSIKYEVHFGKSINKNDYYYYKFQTDRIFKDKSAIELSYFNKFQFPEIVIVSPEDEFQDSFYKLYRFYKAYDSAGRELAENQSDAKRIIYTKGDYSE